MPEPVKVLIARFPGGNSENPDVTDWLVHTVCAMKEDIRVSDIFHWRRDDTPVDMSRNNAVELAKTSGADLLLMVDNDMKPDAYLPSNTNGLGKDSRALPFWLSSFNFAWDHRFHKGPCVIFAPYCGPPPHENVYVFHWTNMESGAPMDQDMSLSQYGREWATEMTGIRETAAGPTGLILIDMDVFKELEPPYFYYEWTDKNHQQKASTEDVTFTRDVSLRGIPIYCNWDTWAGHWKRKCVGRPIPITSKQISEQFTNTILRKHLNVDRAVGEEFVMVGGGADGKSKKDVRDQAGDKLAEIGREVRMTVERESEPIIVKGGFYTADTSDAEQEPQIGVQLGEIESVIGPGKSWLPKEFDTSFLESHPEMKHELLNYIHYPDDGRYVRLDVPQSDEDRKKAKQIGVPPDATEAVHAGRTQEPDGPAEPEAEPTSRLGIRRHRPVDGRRDGD